MKLKTLALAITATVASFSAAAETEYKLPISNTAKISYSINSTVIEDTDTTSFVVDRKVTFDLTGTNSDQTVNAGETTTSIFTLTNTSNAPIGYTFSLPPAATPTLTVKYYVDTNNDGIVTPGTDTLIDANTIVELSQDTGGSDHQAQVIVEVVAAGNATDADAIDYTLAATAVEPATGFIGTAGNPIAPTAATASWIAGDVQTVVDLDPTNGADAGDTGIIRTEKGTYTIGAAKVSLAKSVLVIEDPITGVLSANNFPKAIPGAIVEYTLTITNSGSLDATQITLTDDIPAPFDLSDAYTELFYDENNAAITAPAISGNTITFTNINVAKAADVADSATHGKTIIKFTVKLP